MGDAVVGRLCTNHRSAAVGGLAAVTAMRGPCTTTAGGRGTDPADVDVVVGVTVGAHLDVVVDDRGLRSPVHDPGEVIDMAARIHTVKGPSSR